MSELLRMTINLTAMAAQALNELQQKLELSKTDVINRAVQVYAFIEKEDSKGKELYLRSPDGTLERVHIV